MATAVTAPAIAVEADVTAKLAAKIRLALMLKLTTHLLTELVVAPISQEQAKNKVCLDKNALAVRVII
jgi:hypothetical protein